MVQRVLKDDSIPEFYEALRRSHGKGFGQKFATIAIFGIPNSNRAARALRRERYTNIRIGPGGYPGLVGIEVGNASAGIEPGREVRKRMEAAHW